MSEHRFIFRPRAIREGVIRRAKEELPRQQSGKSRLLALPPECLAEILKYLLVLDGPVEAHIYTAGYHKKEEEMGSFPEVKQSIKLQLGITAVYSKANVLRSCQRQHHEGAKVLYGVNEFHFTATYGWTTLPLFLDAIGPKNAAMIRRVALIFPHSAVRRPLVDHNIHSTWTWDHDIPIDPRGWDFYRYFLRRSLNKISATYIWKYQNKPCKNPMWEADHSWILGRLKSIVSFTLLLPATWCLYANPAPPSLTQPIDFGSHRNSACLINYKIPRGASNPTGGHWMLSNPSPRDAVEVVRELRRLLDQPSRSLRFTIAVAGGMPLDHYADDCFPYTIQGRPPQYYVANDEHMGRTKLMEEVGRSNGKIQLQIVKLHRTRSFTVEDPQGGLADLWG